MLHRLFYLLFVFACSFGVYAQNSFGNLTIVNSGGASINNGWEFVNNTIQPTSATTVTIDASVVNYYLTANPLTIRAGSITFNANVTGTNANNLSILSNTYIDNSSATTITTQGGNVLFASNVDDATDGETTTNGYIQLRNGITVNSNGGNITFGGGNTSGTDYALGSSVEAYTEGIRFDGIIALNSSGGNISLRGKSYAMGVQFGFGASGVGFYFFSAATGTINSGTGTITIDGYSQTHTSSYASGFYCMHALTISSANTTANAISITGKAMGASGEAWGIESESTLSVLATGSGGGITINTSKQLTDNYDAVFRGETNILAVSGPINLKTGQLSGITNGYLYINGHMYLGSKAGSAVTSSSSNINIQVDRYHYENYAIPKIGTSGSVTIQPNATSFGMDIYSSYFNLNQNSQNMSGFTIGKTGNASNIYLNTAITATGPVNVHGATIGISGALTASGSDLSIFASTAVTQSQPIVSSGLSLNGTGTFTLTNTSNSFSTLAGGAVGSLLGATQVTDISGGLTIGTIGSNSGLKGSSTILVETLAGNLTLAGSISTNSTSTDAVILTAAKTTAIGVGTGGDIIVSGSPTITMGSGGIAKLFSGLESTSTGLTALAGGSSNVRNNYDETTSTFSPVLSANNKYAIYRTSAGVGALTIVSSSGDDINTTWTYDNGVINTITSTVNILSSVIENYLTSGPLTINAGNTTISAAITSTYSNALVLNGNSTLSNTSPTTNVNAAITNAGSITINTGTFNVAQNITTTSTAAITISATTQISTSTATRRTIGTQGGNITLNADSDANGTGWLDIDDLTLNPGAANLIVRGETFNVNPDQSRKTYINGTGSFTFESNDASFGSDIGSAWFVMDQDANGISGLTIGKSGSTANIYLNSSFTVAGPISVYGGYVEVSSTVTSSGNYDILLKGIANSGSSVNVYGTITKSSGTGTLTMQANGRAINSGIISATGTGVLNLVMWSDFDGDNVGGGSTLNGGSISTNGGHVWLGGSNSNGGSYTWNGLTVGNGPSVGAPSSNCNSIDLFCPITTSGGDVLLWASNGGCGTHGIASDGTRLINAGSGDITFIAYQTSGAIELTSTGVISLLPEAGAYAAALTVGGTLSSGNFTFNTSYYNGLKINSLANSGLVIGNFTGHLNSGAAVTQGNSSNVTVSSALSTKSLEIYGGAIALNENLTTSGLNADMLIKATSNINLAASKTISTNAGDVNLWADSDDNATGYVQLLSSAVINSTGGDINLGGGASLTTDYAFGTTAETCPEATGTQYISGVHMRNGSSLSSNGGNITVRGQNANTANAAMSFGVSLRGVVMTSVTGKISINGVANGSGSVNAQGVASWGTLTLRSANTSSDAISITGNALSSVGTSSLGVNAVALFEATGVGGGIMITGKSGIASTNASVNLGGDILALSGPITISGENVSGTQDNIYFGSATIIGKKAATNVTTSSSNVLLEGNVITTPGSLLVDCSGTLTVQPFGNSFASAVSWPMTNITHAVGLSGLTIGKQTNTSNVTFSNTTTISGPITAYGGAITVSSPLTAAGNILLDGDTGSFLSQNSKGVSISAALTTTNNGNITIHGRGGNATAINTHGINVTNLVEAGGTGNIELVGYGGLSSNNSTGSSCHGVNIEGASAWVKSNGGNVAITGFGGGAGAGTYSQGVVLLTNAKASAASTGTVNIAGTGGVNTAIGLRGIILTTGSSIYSAGGAISLTGNTGTNGSDNSDGVTIDASSLGSNTSGPITITGTAGGGTGSDAITLSGTNTVGATSHANTINLKGNNLSITGATSILTTGQVIIEPTATSFTSAILYPITNLSLANTITGLTLGKTGNTADLTMSTATTINGPITLYGGTLNLNANLTTTSSNSTASNISLNGSTISGTPTLTLATGSTLTMNLSSNTNFAGPIVGTSLSFLKNGAGTLSLTGATALSFVGFTISGGTYRLNGNQQLTLSNALTNNGTFTMKDGATFLQGTSVTSITGTGTYNVEKALSDNSPTWTTTSGRFWYMGVPMVSVARSSYGTSGATTNRVWSYAESTKSYTELTSGSTLLSAGTGYVHRRTTNDTLTFSAVGANGLYGGDLSLTNLTRTAGTSAGYHLVSNPYMAYLDWNSVTKTNIEPTFYIRTNNTTNSNISALISYNSETNLSTNTSSVTATTQQLRYIAPLQSIWVRVGTAAATGSLGMTRGMLSHQTGNVGLKSSTVFPTLARVNLVDGNYFDQLLVYLNSDMSNEVDQYDSEKMAASGTVQVYTMSSNRKLVMNGLKNNKKKVSVPLYLELPETKSYTLQLSEYMVEDGLILLEDKQEGTIQDFTLMENYSFYANSGLLQNRFVLHFILPDPELTTQGPSNSWVASEGSYTEGGDVEIFNDDRGNIEITLNQPEDQKVEGTVFVTDMNGKAVYSGQLEGIITAIELDVPSGIYYLTVQSGTLIEKKKVFIQE